MTGERPRLFLSYSHDDNESGNFDWVVQELEEAGIQIEYDEIVLIPGRRLWPQIERRFLEPSLKGWGILLTATSLQSQPCLEELEYARLRALNGKGMEFPLIGLVDRVPAEEIPLAIRARLYVDFKDPGWTEKVLAALMGRAPRKSTRPATRYQWKIHRNYANDPELLAVEAGPRLGSIFYFAMIYPEPRPEFIGVGPANGGAVSASSADVAEWEGVELFGERCRAVSMKGRLDPGISAYAVFRGVSPRWIAFGPCPGPATLPQVPEIEKLIV